MLLRARGAGAPGRGVRHPVPAGPRRGGVAAGPRPGARRRRPLVRLLSCPVDFVRRTVVAVQEYRLPDVGEGLTEAEIVSWKVAVGDTIGVNDVVVEIETAKSLVELPSPYAGTVTALLVPEGETVPVGTPIIAIGDPAESAAEETPAPAPPPVLDLSNPAAGAKDATLVGYGPRSGSALRRARRGPATAPTMAGSAAQMQVQGSFALGQ